MSSNQKTKGSNQQSEFCQQFACDLQTCLDSKKIIKSQELNSKKNFL